MNMNYRFREKLYIILFMCLDVDIRTYNFTAKNTLNNFIIIIIVEDDSFF